MTSFVHLEYSNQHAGVTRVETAIASVTALTSHVKRNFFGTYSLAVLLLSAIAAAVMVAAYQVMENMADGHLLVLWTSMWAVAFVALAAFASSARNAIVGVKNTLDQWSRNVALRRADERLWAMAKTDARLMADLQAVLARNGADDESMRFVMPVSAAGTLATKRVATKVQAQPAYRRLYV